MRMVDREEGSENVVQGDDEMRKGACEEIFDKCVTKEQQVEFDTFHFISTFYVFSFAYLFNCITY